ncbi:hypothetical protein PBRA_001873 [Plasmodiophora brassicae]|uniref:J domain-containing protein n=1 Tax=Plasmodiophora brassicae TaxID=37360 RepID=A0A0G4J194_PLABS|nr:hypothetical protein PBRA_001873 [Plasmodiophora brassicae]
MGKDYYKILGVNRDASEDEIKKAYRKQAMIWHPDKNADKPEVAKQKFQDIAEAFEVLHDKDKRAVFDRYGEEGLKQAPVLQGIPDGTGGQTGGYTFRGNPQDIFEQFFAGFGGGGGLDDIFMHGGMGGPRGRAGSGGMPGFGGFGGSGFGGSPFGARAAPSKPEPHVTQVPVSLEDLYTGFSKKLAVTRKRPTPDGRGVRDDKTVLIIDGQKGWKSGTKVTFENEGDQFPGTEAGDLTFVITEKPHMRFKRDGNTLIYRAAISLRDALCGANIEIITLDGRTIKLNTADSVLSPTSVKYIKGEGMPMSRSPTEKGDMKVEFDIKFPKTLPDATKAQLHGLLPA